MLHGSHKLVKRGRSRRDRAVLCVRVDHRRADVAGAEESPTLPLFVAPAAA